MSAPRDPAITAKIIADDRDAAAWLALADERAGCIDPRAADDLRESVRLGGTASPGALDALCRIILGLECDAHDSEVASARRTFDRWFGDAERELGAGFGAHARALAELLRGHGLHVDAVRVLTRATQVPDREGWMTGCALGASLCEAGDGDRAMTVLRGLSASSTGTAQALDVRTAFASVAMRLGQYDEAIALYRELSVDEARPEAQNQALLQLAIAARCSGDEPAARAELSALLEALGKDDMLATPFGARVTDELLTLLILAEDENAIAVQEALVTAVTQRCGAAHEATLQERANLSVVLRAVGREGEAEALAAELTGVRPEGLSFDRLLRHCGPLVA